MRALSEKKVDYVLKWISADHEREVKDAFKKTLRVRAQGETARELADRFFFETLVRLHRQGEGAPYTGLKPAGTDPGPAVTAADRALEARSVDRLAKKVAAHADAELRRLFKRALKKKQHADHSAAAGRKFVQAYVTYVHFVEALHKVIHATQAHGERGGEHGAGGHAH